MKYRALLFAILSSILISSSPITISEPNFDTPIIASKNDNKKPIKKDTVNYQNYNGIQIHTVNLNAPGDCTLVKFGKTEILIDAGGTLESAPAILNALNTYVDGALDFAIFTHGDSDHITNFSEAGAVGQWLISNSNNYINTFIDFDLSLDTTIDLMKCPYRDILFDSNEYLEYKNLRSRCLSSKKIKNLYTGSQCVHEQRGISAASIPHGATNIFNLENGNGEYAELKILYNYFFDHSLSYYYGYEPSQTPSGADKNQISIPALITYKDQKFLFTGDLEEFDSGTGYKRIKGESLLVEYNYDDLKNGVLFFKAGHHGASTSNSTNLLNVIRPQYVVIHANINNRFKHPTSIALTNLLKWTDFIYITGVVNSNAQSEMFHGNIEFYYNGNVTIEYQNPLMTNSIYANKKFKELRELKCDIYNLNFEKNADGKIVVPYNSAFQYNAIYIKAGHIDILVGAGIQYGPISSMFTNQIKHLCNDKVLDYIILPTLEFTHISDIAGNEQDNTGLLYDPYFKAFGRIIYPTFSLIQENNCLKRFYKGIEKLQNEGRLLNAIPSDKITSPENNLGRFDLIDTDDNVNINLYLKFLSNPYNSQIGSNGDRSLNSLAFVFCFDNFKYLNVGNLFSGNELMELYNLNSQELSHQITCFQIPNDGYTFEEEKDALKNFITSIRKQNTKSIGFILLLNGTYYLQPLQGGCIYPSKFYQNIYTDLMYDTKGFRHYNYLYALNYKFNNTPYQQEYILVEAETSPNPTSIDTKAHVRDYSPTDGRLEVYYKDILPAHEIRGAQ